MLWHDYIPVNLKLRRTRSRADSKIRRFSSVVSKQRRWYQQSDKMILTAVIPAGDQYLERNLHFITRNALLAMLTRPQGRADYGRTRKGHRGYDSLCLRLQT
jgi:hypothetical protein